MSQNHIDFTKPSVQRAGPPIPIGKPVNIKKLSDLERKALGELGLQDATMLPDNLHAIMRAARADAQDVSKIPDPAEEFNLPSDFQAAMPQIHDVADLPPAERRQYEAEIRNMLNAGKKLAPVSQQEIVQQAVAQTKFAAEEEARFTRLDPTVARAIMQAQQEPEVTNDIEETPAPATPAKEHKCDRCGHKDGDPVGDKITEQDMFLYLQTLLSSDFVKTYKKFDGRFTLLVRTLTPYEQDAIQAQIFADQSEGRVVTQYDYLEYLMRYRSVLQLVQISDSAPDGKSYTLPRGLDAWKHSAILEDDPDRETHPVAAVWKKVTSLVLRNESAYRLVNETVVGFNTLVANIEKASLSPNFLPATGK